MLLQAVGRPGSASTGEALGLALLAIAIGPAVLLGGDGGAAGALTVSAALASVSMTFALRRPSMLHAMKNTRHKGYSEHR